MFRSFGDSEDETVADPSDAATKRRLSDDGRYINDGSAEAAGVAAGGRRRLEAAAPSSAPVLAGEALADAEKYVFGDESAAAPAAAGPPKAIVADPRPRAPGTQRAQAPGRPASAAPRPVPESREDAMERRRRERAARAAHLARERAKGASTVREVVYVASSSGSASESRAPGQYSAAEIEEAIEDADMFINSCRVKPGADRDSPDAIQDQELGFNRLIGWIANTVVKGTVFGKQVSTGCRRNLPAAGFVALYNTWGLDARQRAQMDVVARAWDDIRDLHPHTLAKMQQKAERDADLQARINEIRRQTTERDAERDAKRDARH